MKDDINAILYVVAISEFDLGCYEDSHTLRLHEAMDLFGEVIDARFLDNKTVILFFNKNDLFVEKISRVKFSDTFIDYTGDENNDQKFVEFKVFCLANSSPSNQLDTPSFVTHI